MTAIILLEHTQPHEHDPAPPTRHTKDQQGSGVKHHPEHAGIGLRGVRTHGSEARSYPVNCRICPLRSASTAAITRWTNVTPYTVMTYDRITAKGPDHNSLLTDHPPLVLRAVVGPCEAAAKGHLQARDVCALAA